MQEGLCRRQEGHRGGPGVLPSVTILWECLLSRRPKLCTPCLEFPTPAWNFNSKTVKFEIQNSKTHLGAVHDQGGHVARVLLVPAQVQQRGVG